MMGSSSLLPTFAVLFLVMVVLLLTIISKPLVAEERRNSYQNVATVGVHFTAVLYHTIEHVDLSHLLDPKAILEGSSRTVVIGGVDYEASLGNFSLSGIQIYSIALWRTCAPPHGVQERQFAYHTSSLFNNTDVYIHGGVELGEKGERLIIPHLYKLKIRPILQERRFECVYEVVNSTGDIPAPRFAHSMVKYDEDTFYILNGCKTLVPGRQRDLFHSFTECSAQYSDLHKFTLSTRRWKKINVNNLPSLSFNLFGIFELNNLMFFYTFGGYVGNSLNSDRNQDMIVFPIPNNEEATINANTIPDYEPIFTRNRGVIDSLERSAVDYFSTPIISDPFSNSLRVVPLRGEFFGDTLDTLKFTWSSYDFISSFHVPGSAVESLNSFALGGGLSYRKINGGEGMLVGVLINVAFGDVAPIWHVNVISPTVIATNTIVPNSHIAVRTFGTVSPLDEDTFLLIGGIASGPRSTSFLLNIEKNAINDTSESFVYLSGATINEEGEGESTANNFQIPPVRVLPNLPSPLVARAGHCVVQLDEETTLIAGGTFDFLSLEKIDDAFFRRKYSNISWVADEVSNTYKSLHINGHRCFKRGSFVFSVGGERSFSSNDTLTTQLYSTQKTESIIPDAPIYIWNRNDGWSPCHVDGFNFSLSYGVAEMLETAPVGINKVVEEVIWYGGWDTMEQSATDKMFRLSCDGKNWDQCGCSDLRIRTVLPPINVPGPQDEEGEFWPTARLSMCSAQMGKRRMVMSGGHFNGNPRPRTYTLEFDPDGELDWSVIHTGDGGLVSHPNNGIGPMCFSWGRYFYSIGGAGNGALINNIVGFFPTCNLGTGIPSSETYLSSSCESCAFHEFRETLFEDSCSSCNTGIERIPLSPGSSSRECAVCDPNYCLNGGECFVTADVEAACNCPFWYGSGRCEKFLEDKLFQAIFIPISLIAITVIMFFAKGYLNKVKVNAAIHERLLSDTTAELYELHSTWEISPNELDFIKSIGRGGFGDVWLAKWLVKDELVAVKKLLLPSSLAGEAQDSIFATRKSPSLQADDGEVGKKLDDWEDWEDWGESDSLFASFADEIKFMKSIKHRNIVYFLGACLDVSSDSFIVMEYVSRGSLADVIANTSIVINRHRRINFMQDAAAGMNYLHNLSPPRIHRDLKSFNLLVSENWIVKVADFTTAKKLLQSHKNKSNGKKSKLVKENADDEDMALIKSSTLGTVPWTAPEVLQNRPYSLSVDVYSFGIVLWEVLTRKLPYEELRFTSQIMAVVLRGERPDIPEEMWENEPDYLALVTKCWDQDPDERPTFNEIEKQLAQLYYQ
eukprot:m.101006 g.101006  ORF g.101006 m.101006 type:complete len:1306 (-) comp9054_c0_seq8:766-4683(-)